MRKHGDGQSQGDPWPGWRVHKPVLTLSGGGWRFATGLANGLAAALGGPDAADDANPAAASTSAANTSLACAAHRSDPTSALVGRATVPMRCLPPLASGRPLEVLTTSSGLKRTDRC